MNTWTTYTKLKLHLERYMYKRGAHKGEAPADASRRSKTHFRVRADDDKMVVRMHRTDILIAYEDGTVRLSTGGWWTSTTLRNLNTALGSFFTGRRMWVGGRRVFGMSQKTITRASGTAMFFDGIMFDADGNQRGTPLPFERKRKDREATAEFRRDLAEAGFKDTFPILFQSATPPANTWLTMPLRKIVTNNVHASAWPHVVSLVKYTTYGQTYDDWRDAWKSLITKCTKDLTEVVRTDVLVINP